MISKTTEYSIRFLLYLSTLPKEDKASIQEISEAVDSPYRFTAKLLQDLRKKKFVSAVKGPKGGYFMDEAQRMKNLEEVIETMTQGKFLEGCILGLSSCSDEKPCPMHDDYKSIRQRLKVMFSGKTFAELSDKIQQNNSPLRR